MPQKKQTLPKLKQSPITPPRKTGSNVGTFFAELWFRLSSSTPTFFKIIRNIAGFIAALGTIALVIQGRTDVDFPDFIDRAVSWTLVAGAIAAAVVAQLPTEDKASKVREGDLPFTAKRVAEGKDSLN